MLVGLGVFLTALAAGFLGGLMGVGGGALMVPLFVILLGIPIHSAVGISLAAVTATALSSSLVYFLRGEVNFRVGLVLESASIIGVLISANVVALMMEERVLEALFGGLLFALSLRMARGAGIGDGVIMVGRFRWVASILGSFAAGFIAGLLGIGGGVLNVPIMVLLLCLPIRTAVATSLFMISITASIGSSSYLIQGLFPPILAIFAVAGAALGAQLGSRVGLRANPLTVRRVFAVFLFVLGVVMLLRSFSFLGLLE